MKNKIYNLTDPWEYSYSIKIISLEESKSLIDSKRGKKLLEFSSPNTQCFHLDTNEVILLTALDACLFSSFRGFISNWQTSGANLKKKINQSFPKTCIKYALDGQRIVYKEISSSNATQIINSIAYSPSEQKHHYFSTYSNKNGKTLMVDNDKYYFFESTEDYNSVIKKLEFKQKNIATMVKQNIIYPELIGRNPYGKDFPLHIPELLEELKNILSVSRKKLDFSIKSLFYLDKKINNYIITAEFSDKIFLPLLAYIGEVYLKRNNSQWSLYQDLIFNTIVPDIKNKYGNFKLIPKQLLKILDPTDDTYYPLSTALLNNDEKK